MAEEPKEEDQPQEEPGAEETPESVEATSPPPGKTEEVVKPSKSGKIAFGMGAGLILSLAAGSTYLVLYPKDLFGKKEPDDLKEEPAPKPKNKSEEYFFRWPSTIMGTFFEPDGRFRRVKVEFTLYMNDLEPVLALQSTMTVEEIENLQKRLKGDYKKFEDKTMTEMEEEAKNEIIKKRKALGAKARERIVKLFVSKLSNTPMKTYKTIEKRLLWEDRIILEINSALKKSGLEKGEVKEIQFTNFFIE